MNELPKDNDKIKGMESTLDTLIEEFAKYDDIAYYKIRAGLDRLQEVLTAKGYKGYWNEND